MQLGQFRLSVLSDGEFRLDGGAMFGVIPKVMWSPVKWCDERNRIRMATNCLLVEAGPDLVLVDTGKGDKQDAKFEELYGYQPGPSLPDAIRAAGFELGDLTHVVLTHLHFDHCGWNTTRTAAGSFVPTFPRARYWLNRGEVEHARQPNERDRASYLPYNWEPLFAAGVVELFDDRTAIVAGVEAVKAPGHNADMCVVTIDGGGGAKAVFWADLVPHATHVPYPWIMSYDLYPVTTLESKRAWIPRAAEERWLCVFEHDADQPLGRIVEEKPGRFRAIAVDPTAAG